jgi:hypothetical protein
VPNGASVRVFVVVVALVLAATTPGAHAAPCDADAGARSDAIRAHLEREVHRGRVWDRAWAAGFGVVTAGYVAMGATRWQFGMDVDDHKEAGIWVTAAVSGISAVSHLVLPVKIEQPAARTGDPCKDLDEARRALDVSADHEAQSFWLGVAGGVVLGGGSLLVLGLHYHTWTEGVISAVTSVPVTIVHSWTTPQDSRRARNDGSFDGPPVTWRLDAAVAPGFGGLVMSGTF